MRLIKNPRTRFLEATLALFLFAVVVLPIYWWWQPSPYEFIRVEMADQQPVAGPVTLTATVFRKQLCPYMLERRVFDATGRKVFERSEVLTTPNVARVAVKFPVALPIGPPPAAPGPAYDEVRVGSMCNLLRRFYPLWEPWIITPFEFVE